MAYSSLAEIQSEFKSIVFSGSSAITNTTVASFQAQTDAYIDGVLALKYQTPISGTNALLIVKSISIWVTTQRIKNILKVKTGDKESEQDTNRDWMKLADDRLDKIVKGHLILSDAVLHRAAVGIQSYTDDNAIAQVFQTGIDQW